MFICMVYIQYVYNLGRLLTMTTILTTFDISFLEFHIVLLNLRLIQGFHTRLTHSFPVHQGVENGCIKNEWVKMESFAAIFKVNVCGSHGYSSVKAFL